MPAAAAAAATATALAFRRPRIYTAAALPRLWFETLEPRRVLSVTIDNGILTIRGTDAPEDFTLAIYTGTTIEGGPDQLFNMVGVDVRTIPFGGSYGISNLKVRGILIDAGGGNDRVTVEDRTFAAVPITVLGGAGDDTLAGSSADDLIDGQAGNDSIVASAGHDTLPDDPWAPYPDRDPEVVYDRYNNPVGRIHLDTDTGALLVTGTDADEVIEIAVPENQPSRIGVWINEVLTTVPRAAVTSIRVDTAAGNDTAYLYSWGEPISVPVTLIGGAGNDLLYGQWYMSGYPHDLEPLDPNTVGPLTIFGGDGNDTLYGGAGDSYLDAGPGTDVMEPRGPHTTYVDPPDPEPTPAPTAAEPDSPENPTTDPSDQTPDDPAPTPSGGPPAPAAAPPSSSSNVSVLFTSDEPLLSQRRDEVWS